MIKMINTYYLVKYQILLYEIIDLQLIMNTLKKTLLLQAKISLTFNRVLGSINIFKTRRSKNG